MLSIYVWNLFPVQWYAFVGKWWDQIASAIPHFLLPVLIGLWFVFIFDCEYERLRGSAPRHKVMGRLFYSLWLLTALGLLALVPSAAEYLRQLSLPEARFDSSALRCLYVAMSAFVELVTEFSTLIAYAAAMFLAYRALDLALRATYGCSLKELMGKGSTTDSALSCEE